MLSGAKQLQDGAAALQDGAVQLADGSATLKDGLVTLTDGSGTLWTALQDGATEISDINSTDDTYDMFASPVDAEETYASHVENNGHAMAAYMMAVGLWVACLAYCIMFSPYEVPVDWQECHAFLGKEITGSADGRLGSGNRYGSVAPPLQRLCTAGYAANHSGCWILLNGIYGNYLLPEYVLRKNRQLHLAGLHGTPIERLCRNISVRIVRKVLPCD